MSTSGTEVACTVTIWRTGTSFVGGYPDDYNDPYTGDLATAEAVTGYEAPGLLAGITSGSVLAPGEVRIWDDTTPPPPPGNEPSPPNRASFSASNITGASFTFRWAGAVSSAAFPVLGYNVTIGDTVHSDIGTEATVVEDVVRDSVGSLLEMELTGLALGTVYTITVTAYNAVGESAPSDVFTVQTLSNPNTNVPNAPTQFRAVTVGPDSVGLAWTASTLPVGAPAVTGYNVYRNGTELMKSVGAVTSSTLTNLNAGTAYALTIRAVNANGESNPSSIVNVTTLSVTAPPATPTGFRVTGVGNGSVSLAWNPNTDVIDGYKVYRTGTTAVVTVAGTSTTISGLTNGTAYTFTLRAYRGTETSGATAGVTATPVGTALPTVPTGLTATPGDGRVTLDWNDNPAADNVTGYRVNWGTSSGTVAVSAATIPNLANNTAYTFTVQAINAAGTSAASAPVTATPRADVVVATGLPYKSTSFFKSRVDGPGVPIDATRTSQFHQFMDTFMGTPGSPSKQAEVKHPRLNIDPLWAMTYHIGKATDPVWKLREGISPNTGKRVTFPPELSIAKTQGFHMADSKADTFPSGDQDRPGCMIDHVFGYTIQFADGVPFRSERIIECTGPGIMYHSSNGLDKRNPKSDDSRNFTSRGRIVNSMIITREDLDRAVRDGTGVGHMLHLFHCETNTNHGFCHPMINAESGKAGWGCEGERVRVKPSVDLVARGLTGAMLAVGRTLQQHGGILGDNSGSVTLVKMAQPQFYTGTNIATNGFQGKLFWRDFEVVQKGWQ